MKSGTEMGHPGWVPWILIRCPRVDSNHHASRHRPSTCCVYHSATRANYIISHEILYQTLLLVNPHRLLDCSPGSHYRGAAGGKYWFPVATGARCFQDEECHGSAAA